MREALRNRSAALKIGSKGVESISRLVKSDREDYPCEYRRRLTGKITRFELPFDISQTFSGMQLNDDDVDASDVVVVVVVVVVVGLFKNLLFIPCFKHLTNRHLLQHRRPSPTLHLNWPEVQTSLSCLATFLLKNFWQASQKLGV